MPKRTIKIPKKVRTVVTTRVRWTAVRSVYHAACGRWTPLPYSNYSGQILCNGCDQPVAVPSLEG